MGPDFFLNHGDRIDVMKRSRGRPDHTRLWSPAHKLVRGNSDSDETGVTAGYAKISRVVLMKSPASDAMAAMRAQRRHKMCPAVHDIRFIDANRLRDQDRVPFRFIRYGHQLRNFRLRNGRRR